MVHPLMMSSDQASNWGAVREQGAKRFILIAGAAWGGLMFGAMTAFALLLTAIVSAVSDPQLLAAKWQNIIIVNAGAWTLGGALFGVATWYASEFAYRRKQR